MTEGDKVIVSEDDWYNAFGEQCTALQLGTRLVVTGTKRVGGLRFVGFDEHPGLWFLDQGFKALRNLN